MTAIGMFVVYENPSDYPGQVVVRQCFVRDGEWLPAILPHAVVETVDEARDRIPKGLACVPRSPQDDPVIVEVWL